MAALAVLGLAVPAAASAEETVTVQVVRSIAQAPYYIALGKGYFAKEGIKIEAGDIRSALDTIAPLSTGRLDASMGAATAGFYNAAHQGFDLRVVASLGIQGPIMATQPLVRKALWDDGSVRSMKDLKGHTVANNAPGDITEFFLTLMLEKYHMTLKDVNQTPLSFAQQMVAFKNGAIDGGFLPEPLSTTAKLQGTVALLEPDAGVGAGTVTTFLFYGKKFIDERPKVALAFLRAMIRGAHDAQGAYNKNPELAAMIAKEMQLKVEAVEQCTPYAVDPNLDIAKYEDNMHKVEAIHRQNGRVNFPNPLSFANVVDEKLVRQAAASLK
jgi:NitT/TauT family transport system substrate-binding protein